MYIPSVSPFNTLFRFASSVFKLNLKLKNYRKSTILMKYLSNNLFKIINTTPGSADDEKMEFFVFMSKIRWENEKMRRKPQGKFSK